MMIFRHTFLREKSGTFDAFRQFKSIVENNLNLHIKRLRTDRGGEFMSNAFSKFLLDNGIVHETSAADVHQQNGRAERMIRTLREKSQCIRLESSLPESYWEFALETAVHLHNRTPLSKRNWTTPFELWHQHKPDVSYLRTFGCAAYVFIASNQRHNKLSPSSELMIFIGYEPGSKAYRFMRIQKGNSIYVGTTALFDETWFPKSTDNTRPGLGNILHDTPDAPTTSIPSTSGPLPPADFSNTEKQGPPPSTPKRGQGTLHPATSPPARPEPKHVIPRNDVLPPIETETLPPDEQESSPTPPT